jgi:hypothetical protein
MSRDGRAAEVLVEQWLRARGLVPERFSPRRRRLGKTPDFRVGSGGGLVFFVEVKTLTSATPGFGALALKVVRAKAQFDAVNQGGRLANVLALVVTAPAVLAGMIADLAGREASPLATIDLVLGFATTSSEIATLHTRADSRHASLLAGLADGPILGRTA